MDDKNQNQNKYYNPDVSLLLATQEIERKKKIAERVPDLKKIAYIIIGLSVVGIIYTQFFKAYIAKSMGIVTETVHYQDFIKLVGFLILITVGFILLNTSNVIIAKWTVILTGMLMVGEGVTNLFAMDYIGVGICIYIIWWLYNLHESIDSLI
ncbi:MAG: hypothetical protein U0451_01665 [Candidatus Saccharimonadales bacterium]